MRKVKVFGVSRSRDKTGKVVKRSLKEYIMCIHAQVGGVEKTWVFTLQNFMRIWKSIS